MDYTVKTRVGTAKKITGEAIVYLVFQDNDEQPQLPALPQLPEKQLADFSAKQNEIQLFYQGEFACQKLLLIGCGKSSELEAGKLTELGGRVIEVARQFKLPELTVIFPLQLNFDREKLAEKFYSGLVLAGYKFIQYKNQSDDEENEQQLKLQHVTVLIEDARSEKTITRGGEKGITIAEAVKFSRDLGNTPANKMSPRELQQTALEMAEKEPKIKLKTIADEQLKKQGFNLIRAVGGGSSTPPRLLELTYTPENYARTVLLLGKGVTFDSGGISLKPSKKMDEMKFDMSGAGVVLAVIKGAADLNLPTRLIGLIPAVENMPDSSSIRPGDIVESYAGQTVEILNTDAEGRLILADTIAYACQKWGEQADCMIDYATLTGACLVALGHAAAGLMGSDDKLCEQLLRAGQQVNERLWRLPLWKDYRKKLDSKIADIKNIGGQAGTVVAGCFLKNFVDLDKIPRWAHIDIAGTAWGMEKLNYRPKEGATGFGVRLTLEFLSNQ